MSDSTDLSSRPGLILKTAREELNYSLEQVAESLHLRVSVVQSMEQEDYSEFSSDVFLKGYFRSYCRLVNLHEERMVELLDKQLQSIQQAQDDIEAEAKKAAQVKTRKKVGVVMISLVGVALAAVFLVLSFSEDSQGPLPFDAEAFKQKLTAPLSRPLDASTDDNESDTVNQDSSSVNFSEQAGEADSDPSASVQATDRVVEDELDDNASETTQIQVDTANNIEEAQKALSVDSADAAENTSGQNVQDESVDPDLSTVAQVSISFSGDCWLKFTDGTGKTVFAALKKAGQEVKYIGQLPFKIVLGDARQATLMFDQQVFDLTPHTRSNGRAQFVLDR